VRWEGGVVWPGQRWEWWRRAKESGDVASTTSVVVDAELSKSNNY